MACRLSYKQDCATMKQIWKRLEKYMKDLKGHIRTDLFQLPYTLESTTGLWNPRSPYSDPTWQIFICSFIWIVILSYFERSNLKCSVAKCEWVNRHFRCLQHGYTMRQQLWTWPLQGSAAVMPYSCVTLPGINVKDMNTTLIISFILPCCILWRMFPVYQCIAYDFLGELVVQQHSSALIRVYETMPCDNTVRYRL